MAAGSQPQGESVQRLLGDVLDHLLEGLQVLGPDFRYLYVNATAAAHGRRPPEELVGRRMEEVYPGVERTEMYRVLRACLDSRSPARMENEFTYPDGTTGWFELRFEPVPSGMAVLSVDITDRKRAEAALGRSVRALTTLSRSNQTLVRAVEEDSLIRDVARIVAEAGGYPLVWVGLLAPGPDRRLRRAAVARHDGSVSDGAESALADSPAMARLVENALEGGRPVIASDPDSAVCVALPVPTRQGPVGAIVIRAQDADAFDHGALAVLGEVAQDLGYGLDALATRRDEAAAIDQLDELRRRASAIFDHLPHATLVWRVGDDGADLVDANEAARALFQGEVPLESGSSASAWTGVFPEIETYLRRGLEQSGQVHREVECRLMSHRDTLRMALTFGSIPPDLVLLHIQDVTRERRTEAQLLASERLEAVGRLAGGVAHDFNNLLSVILTSTEFALGQIGPSDQIREDLEQVQSAGRRAAALTRQLLAFGRRQMLEPQVTNLNTVVTELGEMMRRVLGADITLAVHTAPDLGSVLADAGQLERVIVNLVLNARDAMPRGGAFTIETANAELEEGHAGPGVAVRPGNYVCLAVTDTGVGMSPDTRDRVFEPFFTTKAGGQGTGLGLSSVYGIIKQSDGYIWVYSEVGRGTTFKIYLPRVDTAVVRREPTARAAPTSGGETLLVVEDEDGVRRATERILKSAGFRVLSASSGPAALALCEEHQEVIHLLVTDVVMPEMSGPEVAARLQGARPGLKVLFMSGYADNAIRGHGIRDTAAHFLAKPFTVEGLQRKVRDVLDGA